MPAENHMSNAITNEELWDIVNMGQANNYPMIGWSDNKTENGIAEGHAYTLLGALGLKNENGEIVHKLIRMRNPWGYDEYTGPWSAKSNLWTPELKKQADFGDQTDGIFYTSLDDWRAEYAGMTVCHYRNDWHKSMLVGDRSEFNTNK